MPYADRVKKLDNIVDVEQLRTYFCLDSDDLELLDKALKAMWERVGALEHAATIAASKGDAKKKFELDAEIRVLSELRVQTQKKISELGHKDEE